MNELILRITPILVCLIVGIGIGLFAYFGNAHAVNYSQKYIARFSDRLDRANIKIRTEEVAIGLVIASVIAWGGCMYLLRSNLIIALFSFIPCSLCIFASFGVWVNIRIKKRLAQFEVQLELVLRMMSGAIRSGLGLRQAMIMVTEEMPDPARHEFNLVLLQTNIGMGINDALERLAIRMPGHEITMMTKSIAIQTQTGGNLGKTLDHLATTIKERRKLYRKVKAITSEATGSAYVIGALPIAVGGVVMAIQPTVRDTLIQTPGGHNVLAIALILEGLGIFSLWKLLQFKV